jgi:hypothetical protein
VQGAADEGGGDDRRESAGGEVGGVLARVAREGGADVAEAEQADPARRRQAGSPNSMINGRRGISRSVEHGRGHDEPSVGFATRYTRTAVTSRC